MGLGSEGKRAKEGLFQVFNLSCETACALPIAAFLNMSECARLLLPCFVLRSHLWQLFTQKIISARVWAPDCLGQMQKFWVTCYRYSVWVFHVQVIVICPPFF